MTPEQREQKVSEILALPIKKEFQKPDSFPIPSGDFLYVYQEGETEQKLKSGIIISGSHKDPYSRRATVYAFGYDCKKPFKEGMEVAVAWHSLQSKENVVLHNGIPYHYIHEMDVHSYLTPECYLTPHIADKEEERRDKRNSGIILRDQEDWVQHKKDTEKP